MELLKVWVALMLSFSWLLRNLKIEWAEDLRGIQITQQNMFNWAVCAVMFSVEGCWLSSDVFHRSGFGVVGAWAHVWEALACVRWQGQLLHYQFTMFLHRVCTKCFIVSERGYFFVFFSSGVQREQGAALCEPQSSRTHYHRLRCKCFHITANIFPL